MRRLPLITALLALAALALAPLARAEFGLSEFDVAFTGPPPEGSAPGTLGEPVNQAGSHPFAMTTSFHFISQPNGKGGELVEEAAKDVILAQAPGFIGNPTAVSRCATAEFLTGVPSGVGFQVPECPDSAAVGVAEVGIAGSDSIGESFFGAVYNLEPPPGVAAKLGFWIAGFPIALELGVAESPPYNILGGPTNISQVVEVAGSTFTLWGNPADHAHDPLRGRCLNPEDGTSLAEDCSADIPAVPFLTMPRACGGPLVTDYATDSWEHPGAFLPNGLPDLADPAWKSGAGESEAMIGCDKLGFSPEVSVAPTTSAAESSAGLSIAIDVSDEGLLSPKDNARAGADIEALELALPAGLTINPSAAEGLGVCTLAQYNSASLTDPGCPASSKLGTLEVDTPILDHTFKGSFYLAAQGDNPFGSLLAAYLMIRDPELGVFVKLPSEITTDPQSGQIITRVTEMPPIPLERVRVNLRQGPRAPLITPPACGTYTTTATLYPSSGAPPLKRTSAFAVSSGPGGGPCPAGGTPPFDPGFSAGTLNNAAGSYAPLYMRFTRADGSQDLTRFSATLPPGLAGKIAGIPACTDAQIAAAAAQSGRAELTAPSCPAASSLGHVVAGAGVGSALTYVGGSLYLAGPYGGAPLSVVAIVPAVAGPFDVGTVVTRVALRLDPSTAQVEIDGAASDPIPHILEGIPLKLRDLRVYADRPSFTLNATSCTPMDAQALAFGSGADPFSDADDTSVSLTERYQAASCASLAFKPKLILRLTGATKRAKNPAFRAELKTRGGDANLKGAVVVLPPSQFIDNAHIANPCTRVQFNQGACPKRTILGRARAFTPLLDEPLEGPVYFRSNGGARKLPDLVASLKGTFDFNLVIAILQAKNARIRTKVLNAPDVPVDKFVLKMAGGKRGLLINNEYICRKKQRAALNLIAQNGRRKKTRPAVKTPACKKKGKAKRSAR